MLLDYLPVLLTIGFVIFVALAMVGLSAFFGPKKPSKEKLTPYECGIPPRGNARLRYPVKFYLVAMVFILFDIETVFLYSWAVIYKELKFFGLIETGIFLVILLLGLVYILRKGVLDFEK
jgi:NADH-quinone oxidoreductase subunit A